jgi:hypothetical protein
MHDLMENLANSENKEDPKIRKTWKTRGEIKHLENLNKNPLSSLDMDIKAEFHKLITLQSKEPIFIDKTANKEEILAILGRPFQIIKEYIKLFFDETHGFFPEHSEGNCLKCSEKIVQIMKADLIWGWFTVDRIVEDIELKVPTRDGINTISSTNEEDETQISHWWVEIGEYIIDLTAEQFNKFLDPSSEKYDPIEVIHKKEDKAKRYVGEERHPEGLYSEEDYDEEENIDWENDEEQWQKRDE